jgi:hypothetical protein
LSTERLTKYLADSNSDLDAAITLYERNCALSEALYIPLQSLEICLRNCINHEMRKHYGVDWMTSGHAPLLPNAVQMINDAIYACGLNYTNNDLVAELKFSFWVGLTGPKNDATLWRKAIHRAFRAHGGQKRSRVHHRLNALRRFRNRVAHHEPIYVNASQMHAECLEAIGWMCAHTCAWATHQSRFLTVAAQHNSG